MDSTSMDHYEKQLYTVFKTFDVDNEEALDRSAVLALCDALQLEDRGAALADTLFERPQARVTFTQFRNGLLSVLGGTSAAAAAATPPPPSPAAQCAPPAPNSDDDSSGREVAPKLVVGAKKYGRRSRPPSASPRPRSPDAPPDPDDERLRRRMKCKRSAPLAETEGGEPTPPAAAALEHDRRVDGDRALELCAALHMDVEEQRVRRLFEDRDELSVGEFFDRLNASLGEAVAGAARERDGDEVPAAVVVDSWEQAGVPHARRLLRELGFLAPVVRAAELSRALEDELRALPPAPGPASLVYAATLATLRLRVARADHRAEAARAEAGKLRADLAAADRRAQALALDVDESQARLEASLQARLRQLEARHAEETRAAAAETAAERERAAAAAARADLSEARAVTEEARWRAAAAEAARREEAGRVAARTAEERAARAEAEAARLEDVLRRALREREGGAGRGGKETPAAGHDAEELPALALLRDENKRLRDRNDELVAELEAAGRDGGEDGARGTGDCASWREEVAGERRDLSLASLNCTDECDQSLVSIDHRLFGHIELIRRLQCLLDGIPQVSLLVNDGCESCGTLQGIITSILERLRELTETVLPQEGEGAGRGEGGRCEVDVQTDCAADADELDLMKKKLADLEQSHSDENQRLSTLVKDLESSLEQMKMEYDKCEDYWSAKLSEEREIYAEEQKISDERLTDLISKISDYEQQFAPKTPSTSLPTIDEKYSLEAQFTDLEDEFDKYKADTETQIQAKDKLIKELEGKIKVLEETPISNGHGASSPIDYLWSQGTIQTPFKSDRRDYQNPAYSQVEGQGQNARSSSDSEREKALSPIGRPARTPPAGRGEGDPQMIHCSELEGQLRQKAQLQWPRCACAVLEARCRQLTSALAHRQMCLDAVTKAARSEGAALRGRVSAAEGAAASLQSRLAAADLLVKDLYLENCQLTHQSRLL